jgi:YesN/AraC family two-component response regulator
VLGAQSDLEVVGEAADGREAIELCRRLRPELVLMNVRMPGMDGLASMRNCKTSGVRFRALVSEGGAGRLELATQ